MRHIFVRSLLSLCMSMFSAGSADTYLPNETAGTCWNGDEAGLLQASKSNDQMLQQETECVPRKVLWCANDNSSVWPKCAYGQEKTWDTCPTGYSCGRYCNRAWTDALNEMLSDPMVNKCHDTVAIRKFLANVLWETGWLSTVYQPADGGAGMIHMIPSNWPINAKDMDQIWVGEQLCGSGSADGGEVLPGPAIWLEVCSCMVHAHQPSHRRLPTVRRLRRGSLGGELQAPDLLYLFI